MTANIGTPIVSHATTTSGSATITGTRRERDRKDRRAVGSRLGKSMYVRLIRFPFRARGNGGPRSQRKNAASARPPRKGDPSVPRIDERLYAAGDGGGG